MRGICWSLKFWPNGIILGRGKNTGIIIIYFFWRGGGGAIILHQLKSIITQAQFTVGVGFFLVC